MTKRKKVSKNVPPYDNLLIPVVNALLALGGSGSIDEIKEAN